MAVVVLLRGANVGGHRTFRPARLAAALGHLDVVNIGAAGTFVVRRPMPLARLRDEFAARLPFETEIVTCPGRAIVALTAREPFAGRRQAPDIVPFVGTLARRPRAEPDLPVRMPASGRWLLRVLARDGRFVLGLYRREMRAIGLLGALDRLFGVPATTRSWGTMVAIAEVLARPS